MTGALPPLSDADFAPVDDWSAAGPLRAVHAYPVDPEGRLLLQLRDDRPGVVWPGTWAAFGGGVEDGEDLRAAILREIEEELGLRLPPAAPRPFARALSDLPGRRRVYAFALDWSFPPDAIRLGEGAGFAFFTPAQLARLEMPGHVRRLTEFWLAARA